ncbi:hypothetical protein AVEN_137746-1 [Araneus ventricosus]|uniref:Uncharacterized protein n=1 Tax=Araneus ventricosus TaxID=182803 RepID=A0A4Y2P232_ARAVE|nr:hypothetical protein AVEN_137746-1 [Araneus ventricosus]
MFSYVPKNADDAISLRFENDVLCCTSENVELRHHFSLSSDYSSPSPFEVSASYSFRGGSASPWVYVPRAKVFKQKAGKFIPPDTLTIQCKIWKMNGSLAEDGECTAVTEVDVERVSFGGMVADFSGLSPDKNKIIHVRSASDESLPFRANIGVTSGGTIFIELIPLSYENIRV